ncbi:MAG: glycerate kinase [Clostridiales bacterium]|jgi:glycerate kinase|nr:glycerate kinase [Clostridiales bacterium]
MKVLRFGLGIRFDVMAGEDESATPAQLWEEIFSVLTTSDVKGLHIYGGHAPYESEDACYLCVFTNGSLKEMRLLYDKLSMDAGVGMYLTASHPFIQTNALLKIEGLVYYGVVHGDGSITGGDETLAITVNKKHGKRRPRGKGIVFLLAPGHYGAMLSSKQAIRRLTIAARNIFRGVRILPLPIADGGPGTVDAVLSFCNGIRRTVYVPGPAGGQIEGSYAVLRGKTAVIEMPAEMARQGSGGDSFGLGVLIRRALDEGLHEIVLGCAGGGIADLGLGCLCALGVKLLDEDGMELERKNPQYRALGGIDTELMHARVKNTRFILMADYLESFDAAAASAKDPGTRAFLGRLRGIYNTHAGYDVCAQAGGAAAGGLAATLMAYCGAMVQPSVQALFCVAEMSRRIRKVSLVVSGEAYIARAGEDKDRKPSRVGGNGPSPVKALLALSGEHNIPVALLAGGADETEKAELNGRNCSLFITAPVDFDAHENVIGVYDDAANRMFRFIRLGREIERVSAWKSANIKGKYTR